MSKSSMQIKFQRFLRIALPMAMVGISLVASPVGANLSGDCAITSDESFLNEGRTDYSWNADATGTMDTVMLFVDFPDAPAGEQSTMDDYNQLMPDTADWFHEVSFGRLELDVSPVHQWFRLPQDSGSYEIRGSAPPTFSEVRAYVEDAIQAADSEVDFGQYVEVVVVPSRNSRIARSVAFLARKGKGIHVDGREIRHGATINTSYAVSLPVNELIHEIGHTLGLPDLYDYDYAGYAESVKPVGAWDVMSAPSQGSHFLAWHKWKLGWIDETQVDCLTKTGVSSVTLSPIEVEGGMKAAVIRTSDSTAYVAEVRSQVGADADLCDEGVLVYKVRGNLGSGSTPIVVHTDEIEDDAGQGGRCGQKYNAPYEVGETFTNPSGDVMIEVLSNSGEDYSIKATYTGDYKPSHKRRINFGFSGPPRANNRPTKGKVSVPDGYTACAEDVPVKLQRRTGSGWNTLKSTKTRDDGIFRFAVPLKRGFYRAFATRVIRNGEKCKAKPSEARQIHRS